MNNKISELEFERALKEHSTKLVGLYSLDKTPLKLGVDWWAIGLVSVDEAEQFANDLQKAIKFVKDFNNKQYILED